MEPTELRELTQEELDNIQGGWVINAVGAAVGAVAGGASAYISSGGDWKATAIGAGSGAAAGFIFPWNSVRSAAMSVGRSVTNGTFMGVANRIADSANSPLNDKGFDGLPPVL